MVKCIRTVGTDKDETRRVNVEKFLEIMKEFKAYSECVLFYMIMNESEDHIFNGTKESIAQGLGLSERTIRRKIKNLEDIGIITRLRKYTWHIEMQYTRDYEYERWLSA